MYLKLIFFFCFPIAYFAQVCNPNGNVVIYTNYDGGTLNINVDQNIPNLKIGICTYEGTTVNLTGAFVNNVTGIIYAGYNASNAHCGGSIINTTINGAPAGASTAIQFAPAANFPNPNGYGSIICGYSCANNSNQGGCNTPDQIQAYFVSQFSGTLRSYYTQYGCWGPAFNVSNGGNCCPQVPLGGSVTSTNVVCAGACNGSASVQGFGGTPPYTYLWSNGQNQSSVSGLCPGSYSVTITDANGQSSISSNVLITDPPSLVTNTTLLTAPCNGMANGGINLTVTGGLPPYTYSWSNGSTIEDPQNLTAGTYTVTVTDANGCSSIEMFTLTEQPMTISAGADQSICIGESVILTGSGGSNYIWNNNVQNGQSFSPTQTTTYTLAGTFASGCTGSDNVVVTVLPVSSITLTETALDSYTLNGQTYTQSGTYTQSLTASNGCDSTITINLTLNYTGIDEADQTAKKLVKITDLNGKVITRRKNTLMLLIYSDGSVERILEMEEN
jgi:hypothetical protein